MIEHGDGACFLLESAQAVSIGGKRFRQDLDRDLTPQARIPSTIDLTHAAGAHWGLDFIGTKFRARGEGHAWA